MQILLQLYGYLVCQLRFIIQKSDMGSEHSENYSQSFRREDWDIVDRGETSSTWQNRRDPTQRIEQYDLYSSSEEEHRHQKEIYYLRKNHPQLVAALYLSSQSSSDFCSSNYQQKLFIEKIPIRLSDIQHIPFPDYLHIYLQCLRGFNDLANHIGFFAVEQEYIGVNERGVVKIWMNPDFSNSQSIGGKVSQEAMVRSIIQIIDRNLDQGQNPQGIPSVKNYIYRKGERLTFQQAISELNNFARQNNNGVIPQKLECIERVGGIYAIVNRDKSFQPGESITNSSPVTQEFSQGGYFSNEGRPQLVDNEILNRPFQIRATQNQGTIFSEGNQRFGAVSNSQIVPSPGNNVLTPSTVRENIPIVRKQTTPYYDSNTKPLPGPQFSSSIKPVELRMEPRVGAPPPVFYNQPPQIKSAYQVNPPVFQSNFANTGQSKVGQAYPNSFVQSNIPSSFSYNAAPSNQPAQNGQSQMGGNYNYSTMGGNLANLTLNEVNPTIRPINEPTYLPFNLQQGNQASYSGNSVFQTTLNEPKPIISTNDAPSNQFTPFMGTSQTRQIGQSNLQFNSALPETNYANNLFNVINNEKPPTINEPSYNLPEIGNYNFNSQSSNNNYQQNSSINMDDGKSSLDFFKKLNEFSTPAVGGAYQGLKFESQPNDNFRKTIEVNNYDYSNPFSTSGVQAKKSLESYDARNFVAENSFSPQRTSEQYFGRNAVSNVVEHQVDYASGSADNAIESVRIQSNLNENFTSQAPYPVPTYFKKYSTSYNSNDDYTQ